MNDLKSLLEVYRRSVFEKDVEGFVSIFDEGVRVFDLWGIWLYEGSSAWRAMAADWLESLGKERVVVEFEDVRTVESEDLASLHAFATFRAIDEDGRELRSLNNRLTWVARRRDGAWKIVHEHTSAPVDAETSKVILKRGTRGAT